MKSNYILLIVALLIGKSTLANEQFNFMNDCIEFYGKLEKVADEFHSNLKSNSDSEVSKTIIAEYNVELNKLSTNYLLKHSKSEIKKIQEVATGLRDLINDLIKINKEYLNLGTDPKYTEKKLYKKRENLIKKNNKINSLFGGISIKICGVSVKQYKGNYSELTLSQRNLLNAKLITVFGEFVQNGDGFEQKSSFANSSRLIYKYINMEIWQFKEE